MALVPTRRATFNHQGLALAGYTHVEQDDGCGRLNSGELDEQQTLPVTEAVAQAQTAALSLCDLMRQMVPESFPAPDLDLAGRIGPFGLRNRAANVYRTQDVGPNHFSSSRSHYLPAPGGESGGEYQYLRPYMVTSHPFDARVGTGNDGGTAATATRGNLEQFLDQVSTPVVPLIPPVFSSIAGVVTALGSRNRPIAGLAEFNVESGFVEANENWHFHGTGTFDYFLIDRPNVPFPVYAVSDGVVLSAGWNASAGNFVIIEHANGPTTLRTLYHHLVNRASDDFRRARDYVSLCANQGPALQAAANCAAMRRTANNSGDIDFEDEVAFAAKYLRDHGQLPSNWGKDAQPLLVGRGSVVYRGQQIGWAGDTGYNSGNVHLHFGIAAESPVNRSGRFWWGFDPYGLYSVPASYVGLYPSGDPASNQLQSTSAYAPFMPDYAVMPRGVFHLGADYYRRIGWSPTLIVPVDSGCGPLFAGSFQFGQRERPARILMDLQRLREECDRLGEQGWIPHSIQWSPGLGFSATWEPVPGARAQTMLYGVPLDDMGAFARSVAAATAGLGFRWRLVDVCPYLDGARLLAVVVIDRSELILPTDPNPDYQLVVGSQPSSFDAGVRRLVREGRVVTRLHAYPQGAETRYLLLHRAQAGGEAVRTIIAADREGFAHRCAQERAAGFQLVGLAVRSVNTRARFGGRVQVASERDTYDAVLLQTTRPRA